MLAQVSLEFLILISLLAVIFSLVFYFNSHYSKEINNRKIFYAAQNIADRVAKEIDMAIKFGDGYSRVFYIEEKMLDSVEYNISYSFYRVRVEWSNGKTESKSLAKEIEGEIKKGKNVIRNIGGKVYVN